MLNLSKITLLLLASIGLTACGALNSLLNEIEKGGDECPLSEEFCELNEDGEQVNRPPDVNVDADILQISGSIEGELGRKSGVLEDISLLADVSSTTVNRESSGNGAEDGFAYLSIDDTSGETRQYVGILSTTDLGNALHYALSTVEEAKASWRGKLTLIEGDVVSTSEEFSIEVDFKSRQISTPEGFPIPTGSDNSASRTGRLNGDFGVAADPSRTPGQMNGTFDIIEDTIDPATMIGLIGEEGAVGVFSGTYFGGFVASPQ
ncbi:MAG: hypothetical protein K8953_10935 [Proteobacteria bacterium]|nr:hypothetical protein [Pseudomonadota bacterium]